MSTTASDMGREDGNSKSTEVQAAPGTRSISVGRVKHHETALVTESHPLVLVAFMPFSFCYIRYMTQGFYSHTASFLLFGAVSYAGLPENEDNSDVQDIIESTPELDMDLIGYKPCR